MKKKDFSLCLVTDRNLIDPNPLEWFVAESIRGGVSIVQLRDKNAKAAELVHLARELKHLLASFDVPLLINDRVDIALASDADGVHLGQDDLPFFDARKILGPDKIIGLSVENLDQLKQAHNLDPDYLAISPVFFSPTKPEIGREWGLEGIKMARHHSSVPLIGIGGINIRNARDVIMAGADGIAVVSALCSSSQPEATASELINIVQNALFDRDGRIGNSVKNKIMEKRSEENQGVERTEG